MTVLNKHAELRKELSNPAIGSNHHLRKLALSLLDEVERANTETDKANLLIDEIRAERNFLQGLAGKRQIDLEATEKRIAELETRSISLTMPPRKTLDDYINDEFDASDLAAIYNACRLECEVKFKNDCHAAGIGVKGE